MKLGATLQLVLQTEQSGGTYCCDGFCGLPTVHPGFIIISTDGHPDSYAKANRLRASLIGELKRIDTNCTSASVMCNGFPPDPFSCHAYKTVGCSRLLVLIGDGTSPIPWDAEFAKQHAAGVFSAVLPALPSSAKSGITSSLGVFSKYNAVFYDNQIEEVTPEVLHNVGITPDERKVFISYRRKDTDALANQLFDALTHKGFDVFLDRFRVPPGVDFQRRLTQELCDKSMLLVLESASFNSEWTQYEVDFAKSHRLALYAISAPGAIELESVEAKSRKKLDYSDYCGSPGSELKKDVLDSLTQEVSLVHGRMLVWRRAILRRSMQDALKLEGVNSCHIGPTGLIHASSPGKKTKYSLSLTPRPPELRDFHELHTQATPSTTMKSIVIGQTSAQEPTRISRLQWLKNVSNVQYFDESEITKVARAIGSGKL